MNYYLKKPHMSVAVLKIKKVNNAVPLKEMMARVTFYIRKMSHIYTIATVNFCISIFYCISNTNILLLLTEE